jgi:uncharacterized protein YkwD
LIVAGAISGCDPVVRAHTTSGSSKSAPPSAAERQVIDSVNRFRAAHHLRALKWNANVSDKAKLWAAYMAGGNCGRTNGTPMICHSTLDSGITVSWTLLEENVGAASPKSNLSGVLSGFEHSEHHAQNMLNPRITSIGAGVAYAGNAVYVAEEFMAQ